MNLNEIPLPRIDPKNIKEFSVKIVQTVVEQRREQRKNERRAYASGRRLRLKWENALLKMISQSLYKRKKKLRLHSRKS